MKTANEILPIGQETFSPKECCQYLPVDVSTVNRWCNSRRIEANKPVGRWYVTRNALAKLLVAFGLASHLVATGMQATPKTIPNTRKIYNELNQPNFYNL